MFERTSCQYLIIRPMFGNLPCERARHSRELFSHEVMPAFAAQPAPTGSGAASGSG